jgi:DmsE family decaheme c-type cytochrome
VALSPRAAASRAAENAVMRLPTHQARNAAASRAAWIVSAAVVSLLLVSSTAWSQTPAADAAQGYVGVKKCTSCHEGEAKGYEHSPHATAWDPRSPAAARGCETCHGPGQSHIDDNGAKGRVRNFLTLAPREVSDFCQTCHNREEHALWQGSMHDARNVTCTSCHSNHKPKSEEGRLVRATVVETCATCHAEKAAKLQRTAHMPLREGKMDCTSCHNQHGSSNVRMLRVGSTVNDACTSCHAEKRGPFLWDHAPVRESCVTCHDPHGSSNDRMLVAKSPMLCQRCHVASRHPASAYDGAALVSQSNRLVGRGCVNCHSNIHGSNHPSGAFFQR